MAPGRSWPYTPTEISSILGDDGAPEVDVIWFPTRSMPARLDSHVGLLMEAKWKPHRTNRPVTGPSASRVSGSRHTRIERQASYIAWAWARVYAGPLESVQMSPPSALLRT